MLLIVSLDLNSSVSPSQRILSLCCHCQGSATPRSHEEPEEGWVTSEPAQKALQRIAKETQKIIGIQQLQ